eukprot:g4058.t1
MLSWLGWGGDDDADAKQQVSSEDVARLPGAGRGGEYWSSDEEDDPYFDDDDDDDEDGVGYGAADDSEDFADDDDGDNMMGGAMLPQEARPIPGAHFKELVRLVTEAEEEEAEDFEDLLRGIFDTYLLTCDQVAALMRAMPTPQLAVKTVERLWGTLLDVDKGGIDILVGSFDGSEVDKEQLRLALTDQLRQEEEDGDGRPPGAGVDLPPPAAKSSGRSSAAVTPVNLDEPPIIRGGSGGPGSGDGGPGGPGGGDGGPGGGDGPFSSEHLPRPGQPYDDPSSRAGAGRDPGDEGKGSMMRMMTPTTTSSSSSSSSSSKKPSLASVPEFPALRPGQELLEGTVSMDRRQGPQGLGLVLVMSRRPDAGDGPEADHRVMVSRFQAMADGSRGAAHATGRFRVGDEIVSVNGRGFRDLAHCVQLIKKRSQGILTLGFCRAVNMAALDAGGADADTQAHADVGVVGGVGYAAEAAEADGNAAETAGAAAGGGGGTPSGEVLPPVPSFASPQSRAANDGKGKGGEQRQRPGAGEEASVDESSCPALPLRMGDPAFGWVGERRERGETASEGGGDTDEKEGSGVVAIRPLPGSDFWARTFYSPLLVKSNAPALLGPPLGNRAEATLHLSFTLDPVTQFDQGGALVFVDADNWLKAGIEYVDGTPRLSVVVTNAGFSDWSTGAMPAPRTADATLGSSSSPSGSAGRLSVALRVHKLWPGAAQGPSIVVEAAPLHVGDDGVAAPPASEFALVRVASLRGRGMHGQSAGSFRMGAYAASPIGQSASAEAAAKTATAAAAAAATNFGGGEGSDARGQCRVVLHAMEISAPVAAGHSSDPQEVPGA